MKWTHGRRAAVLAGCCWGIWACGGSAARAPASSSGATGPAPSASAAASARSGHLLRADVTEVLSAGFGAFLARLQIEPALANGRFHGWRIISFREGDPLWKGIELVPGDIVTSINGRSIERPEEALAVFQSLAVAQQLAVTYERNGVRHDLVYPIDDSPAARP